MIHTAPRTLATTPTLARLRERRLPLPSFSRPTATVARELVGCALVFEDRAGLIVETEAYLGDDDRASHARFGPAGRSAPLFGPAGRAYVYLCYGVHEMFNVVAHPAGRAGAVLIRAVAPVRGLPDDPAVGRGPGKLTRALGLGRALTGTPLDGAALFLAAWAAPPRGALRRGPRIGVDFAGACAARPLRFWWRDHPAVSCRR